MSLPYDATLKDLGGAFPADFLTAFDQPPTRPVQPLNVDLSTVTTAADLVLGLGRPPAEVVHIDFQSSASATKHADVLAYNALLYAHYLVPIHSIVVLLRPAAAHSNLSGAVQYAVRPGRGKMEFGYEVVRLWQRPAEELLCGGLGVLPLAVLGQLPEGVDPQEGLRVVADRMDRRLAAETTEDRAKHLLTAAFVLAGLRMRKDQVKQAFAGVRAMRDSDTYLGILDEGRELEAKETILGLGQKKFGPPDASTTARLEGMSDLERLKRIRNRLFEATSWQDLLDTP